MLERIITSCLLPAALLLLLCSAAAFVFAEEQTAEHTEHTPLAGEAFRTEVFGRDVEVPPRDRRSQNAWDLGFALNTPAPEHAGFLAFGNFYFWRHPPDGSLFRAQLSGVYNEVLLTRRVNGSHTLEWVFTFENYTLPFAQSDLVDGKAITSQELVWGYIRPGFGAGIRRQVSPGKQDNMAAASLTVEPGYLYFRNGSEASPAFAAPQDTAEVRLHLQLRWDAVERNLLELPHRGFAAGADAVYGSRLNWENWGLGRSESAGSGRNYTDVTAYAIGAGPVPGIASEQHRLVGSLHAGIGRNLDRFSAHRIGGGPDPMGEEFEASSYVVLPGAAMLEFYPHRYVIATVEYRWAPVFFAFVCLDGSVARLDRPTQSGPAPAWKDDTLTAVGTRLFSGFFLNSRLQVGYHYNFSVIRDRGKGGNEIVLHVSKDF